MISKKEFVYLSQRDVASVGISMVEVIAVIEEMFREKGNGSIEMPPKTRVHPKENSFLQGMSALIPGQHALGCKWLSSYPGNPQVNLPYISGLLILNDTDTGLPVAIMDAMWITAMRTGAASAVAAKYLAHNNSNYLAILGCGTQGRSHLEAMTAVLPSVHTAKVYDPNKAVLNKFVEDMQTKVSIDIVPVDTPQQAVVGSDIIVTAGPVTPLGNHVIESGWFKAGAFACPIDYDCYWTTEALRGLDKFCTDDRLQLQAYKSSGILQATPPLYAELGEIVAGIKPGRVDGQERIMSMHLGLAAEDVAVGALIYRKAVQKEIGTHLPL